MDIKGRIENTGRALEALTAERRQIGEQVERWTARARDADARGAKLLAQLELLAELDAESKPEPATPPPPNSPTPPAPAPSQEVPSA